jgi:four helix bundle protein
VDDFCHKLSIALKEMRESHVWLSLIVKAKLMPDHRLGELTDECDQLRRILGQSIVTARRNQKRGH